MRRKSDTRILTLKRRIVKALVVIALLAMGCAAFLAWSGKAGAADPGPRRLSAVASRSSIGKVGRPAPNAGATKRDSVDRGFRADFRRGRASTRFGCGLQLAISAGTPLQGAVARAQSEDGSVYESGPSGVDGRAFLDAPCGGLTVDVWASGYVPAHFRTNLSPESLFCSRSVQLQSAQGRTGMVLDEGRHPIPEAVVSVIPLGGGWERPPRRASTQSDGSFEIDLSSGSQRLRVSKKGFQPYSAVVDPSQAWSSVIVLKREGPRRRFAGIVVGRDGRPIPKATVLLRDQGDALDSRSGRTMPDGRFDFAAPAGAQASLVVSAEGCLDLRRSVDLAGDGERRYVLDCYPTFEVKVLDPKGNEIQTPRIAGVSPSTGEPLVNCSPQGRCYSVEYPVRLQAAALGSGLSLTTPLVVSSYTPEIELRIESAGALKGVVEDQRGRPIKSFTVQLREPMFVSRRFDSEDGSFRLESLPSEETVVAVAAPGYRPLAQTIANPAEAGAMVRRWRLTPLPPELQARIP